MKASHAEMKGSRMRAGLVSRPSTRNALILRASHISSFPPNEGGIEGGSEPGRAAPEETPSNSPLVRGRVLLHALRRAVHRVLGFCCALVLVLGGCSEQDMVVQPKYLPLQE